MGVLDRRERGDDNETSLKEGGVIEMSNYSAFHIRDARSLRFEYSLVDNTNSVVPPLPILLAGVKVGADKTRYEVLAASCAAALPTTQFEALHPDGLLTRTLLARILHR